MKKVIYIDLNEGLVPHHYHSAFCVDLEGALYDLIPMEDTYYYVEVGYNPVPEDQVALFRGVELSDEQREELVLCIQAYSRGWGKIP